MTANYDNETFKTALSRFDEDYEAYYVEGKSKEKNIGIPRVFINKNSEYGIIIIHGFMSAPEEVALVGEALYKQGLSVYLPRMPGHGTSPENLTSVNFEEWEKTVIESYKVIQPLCKKVFIAGFSTGAGLALLEAVRRGNQYCGVISISAPLHFIKKKAKYLAIIDFWKRLARTIGIEKKDNDYVVNHPNNPEINYHQSSIHGMYQVKRVMDVVNKGLKNINIPILILQGTGDNTITKESPKEIYDKVSSKTKYMYMIESTQHGIVRKDPFPKTMEKVSAFVKEVMENK